MQKSSLLKNSPWVQAPLCQEVANTLELMTLRHTYYQRGTKKATVDLERCIEIHRKWVFDIVDLNKFPYVYVTSGATEAINHWRLSDHRPWQYFKGDYQYPQMISGNGKEVDELHPDSVLYLSNPQCYNGNFKEFGNIINPVILDCAYIGATSIKQINIPINTEQIMFSFSKGWGLIGQRCGLVYTKEPHLTLQPLKEVECYNYAAAPIMKSIMNKFRVDEMYYRYIDKQKEVCKSFGLTPSDTYFIATSTDQYYKRLRRVGEIARLCLTGVYT